MKTEDNKKNKKTTNPYGLPKAMKEGKKRYNKDNQGARGHVARWFKNHNVRNTSTRRMRRDPPGNCSDYARSTTAVDQDGGTQWQGPKKSQWVNDGAVAVVVGC